MKQFLLFAGTEQDKAVGISGLIGDFDSVAEAFLSMVDNQTPSQWWHVLDTKSGEVIERRHVRVSNGMIGFYKSDWVVGTPGKKLQISAPTPSAKAAELVDLEAGMRAVVANGLKNGNGHANGHAANGSAPQEPSNNH